MAKYKDIEELVLTKEEKIEIQKFINSNPEVKSSVEHMKELFKEHFYMKEEDIEESILKIVHKKTKWAINKFENFYNAFVENDTNREVDKARRARLARQLVDDSIEIYKKKSQKISYEFIKCLKLSKELNIDPFELAIKTNISSALIENFEESIEALSKHEYEFLQNKDTGVEKDIIFTREELTSVIEKCASLAFKSHKSTINEILFELANFVRDDKTGELYADPKVLIRQAPSILLKNPQTMSETIAKLENFYLKEKKMSRKELVEWIAKKPSVLSTNLKNDEKIINKIVSIYSNLVEKFPSEKRNTFGKNTTLRKQKYLELAKEFCYDIDNISQIEFYEKYDLEKQQEVLIKYLGVENALQCMLNFSVIKKSSYYLEYVLAVISSDPNNSKTLRTRFVKNPGVFLKADNLDIEKFDEITNNNSTNKKLITTKRIKEIDTNFPKVYITTEKLEKLQKRINVKQLETLNKNIEEIRKAEAERKKKALQAEKERREKEKAEEKKTKLSKTQMKKLAMQREQELKEKANLEKQQAEEEAKASKQTQKPILPQLSTITEKNYELHELFKLLYEPLVDAMHKNKFSTNLPKLSNIISAFKVSSDYVINMIELTSKLAPIHVACKTGIKTDLESIKKAITDEYTHEDMKKISDIFGLEYSPNVLSLSSLVVRNLAYTLKDLEIEENKIKNKFNSLQNDKSAEEISVKDADGKKLVGTENNSFYNYHNTIVYIVNYIIGLERRAEKIFGEEQTENYFGNNLEYREKLLTYLESYYFAPQMYTRAYAQAYISPYLHEQIKVLREGGYDNSETNDSALFNNSKTKSNTQNKVSFNERFLINEYLEYIKDLTQIIKTPDKTATDVRYDSETGAVKFYTGIKEKGPNESSLRRYDCLLPNSHGYTGKPAFVEVYNSSKLMEFQEDGNMIEYIFNSEEDPNSKIENNQ